MKTKTKTKSERWVARRSLELSTGDGRDTVNEHDGWQIIRENIEHANVALGECLVARWPRQVQVETRGAVALLPDQFVDAANVGIVHVDERIGRRSDGDGRGGGGCLIDRDGRGIVVRSCGRCVQQTGDVLPGDHARLSVDAELTEQFVQMLLCTQSIVVDRVDAEKHAKSRTRLPRFDHGENRGQLEHVETRDVELRRCFRKDEVDLHTRTR